MDPARWAIVKREFSRLQELPAADRAGALEALPSDVRVEVASLLEALAQASPALDGERIGPAVGPGTDAEAAPRERVGPWRIVRTLGRGGMGVVYLGERPADDVTLRAAVKVVAGVAGSADIARRFRAERRILAGLDHPGIARLLDGGTTDDGLPYFALEYVEGAPLTEYVDARGVDLPARLRIFRQVCDAVAFAHSRLVVHRDLKPGNILVTADGTPKLLDFGIAKVVAADGDIDTAPATVTTHGWMTPAYASPEQVRGEPTTTASDVYALGLILYELLAGTSAIPRELSPLEQAKHKLDGTIAKPSTAVRRLDAKDGPTQAERTRRARLLRGDLDTIVLTAIAVDPARRYPSVSAVADEIDRYLTGRPVLARADSVAYRAAKFVGRNRWAVASGTLALIATIAGLVTALAGQQRAERAERDARASAATAERVSEFLVGLFNVNDPGEARGNAVTARELLDAGAARIARELASEPDVRTRLDEVMARAYGELGLYERQRDILQRELDDATRRLGAGAPQTLALMTKLAVPLMRLGRHKEALPLAQAAVTGFERAVPPNGLELGRALTQLSTAQWRLGDPVAAKATGDRAVAAIEAAPDRVDADVMAAVSTAAIARWMRGEYDAARPMYDRLLALSVATYGEDTPNTANVLNNLGILENRAGRLPEARGAHERALAIRRRVLASDHPDIAESLNNLGLIEHAAGNEVVARAHFEEGLAIRRKVLGATHELVATTEVNLGLTLFALKENDAAQAALEQARQTFITRLGPTHPYVAYPMETLAALELRRGRKAEALRMWEEALAIRVTAYGADHPESRGLRKAIEDVRARPQ